jgi:hypothetical protein
MECFERAIRFSAVRTMLGFHTRLSLKEAHHCAQLCLATHAAVAALCDCTSDGLMYADVCMQLDRFSGMHVGAEMHAGAVLISVSHRSRCLQA